jgi:Ca2+-binding RTX toxin-like protein
MTGHPILRTVAVAASAALLLSAFAGPVSAAKPKCAGKTATIVGTAKGEVLTGTRKADVIVARGGHDIIRGGGGNDTICGGAGHDKLVGGGGHDLMFGQTGRDKLFGGPGRDRLLGGPANDRFNGGRGNDACLQGSGAGLRIACERPVPVVVVPVPAPPPGPQLLPLTGILAIAYSDLDGSHSYTVGDVLIAKLVDADGDKVPSAGDTITMGRYPTSLTPGPSDFGDWKVKSHLVDSVFPPPANWLQVKDSSGGNFIWTRTGGTNWDGYAEFDGANWTEFGDRPGIGTTDYLSRDPLSPSEPKGTLDLVEAAGTGDDRFVEVELNFVVS